MYSRNPASRPLTEEELEKIVNDPHFFDSDDESEAEENMFFASEHDSESEASSDGLTEDNENENLSATNYYYSKNPNWKWSKTCKRRTRTRAENIIVHLPGLKGAARNIEPGNVLQAWNLFVSEDMLNTILLYTNYKIRSSRENFKEPHPSYTKDLDLTELKAFIGLLYLSGCMKSGHEDVAALFSSDGTGRDIFRATMSVTRFLFILSCLRFDDRSTRAHRKLYNKLAAVSEIWNLFITNCKSYYAPGENVTIDEMLVPFRGRCSFKMYMPKKPAKYGIKIMCMCDSRTHFMCNAFVYTGKEQRNDALSVPTNDVLKLITPIQGSNRNVVVDNWFMSVELCQKLSENHLTVLGTLKMNKPQLPPEFKPNRKRQVGSTLFGHNDNMTICSYVPKKNRAVVLLSTMHHDQEISKENGKPDMINDYNNAKGGVDSLDQLCAHYSVSRRTRRWPMVIFFAILNISGANCVNVLKCLENSAETNRREALMQLGKSLIRPHMQRRDLKHVPRDLQSIIRKLLGIQAFQRALSEEPPRKSRCEACPRQADRKTKTRCEKCGVFICGEHTHFVCDNCK